MVQELRVLKCFSCETFQSHIVKKTNKWECKVCGVKQSIKKVYGRGSGKDCRLHTQKLNALKGEKEDINQELECEEVIAGDLQNEKTSSFTKANCTSPRGSKWSEYVDEENKNVETQSYFGEERLGYSCETKHGYCGNGVRTKRKYHETDFVEEEPYKDKVDTYEPVKNKYSSFPCFASLGSKKKIKGDIKYTESFTGDDNKFLKEQDCIDELSEDNSVEKNVPSSFKSAKQINSVEISSKWAKYLEEEQDEEDLSQKS
uniref:MRN complex-interacting protein N-terminal domain-containing protein n=1 Tax=Graphocephala atropunctata TaxID=36148 RepID=A0A1B6LE63_9HEMI